MDPGSCGGVESVRVFEADDQIVDPMKSGLIRARKLGPGGTAILGLEYSRTP